VGVRLPGVGDDPGDRLQVSVSCERRRRQATRRC